MKQFIRVTDGLSREHIPEAIDYDLLIEKNTTEAPFSEIAEEDLHTLFYTSGTTGKPKGAMLSQKSWATVAINLILDYGPVTENDVILNTQPLSHGAGFFVLPYFIRGATNVLIPEFKPSIVFETIEREKVTVLKLVPSMLYQLLDAPEKNRYDLSSLHSIIYGGSPHRRAETQGGYSILWEETRPALWSGRGADVHFNVIKTGSCRRGV